MRMTLYLAFGLPGGISLYVAKLLGESPFKVDLAGRFLRAAAMIVWILCFLGQFVSR